MISKFCQHFSVGCCSLGENEGRSEEEFTLGINSSEHYLVLEEHTVMLLHSKAASAWQTRWLPKSKFRWANRMLTLTSVVQRDDSARAVGPILEKTGPTASLANQISLINLAIWGFSAREPKDSVNIIPLKADT